MMRGGVIDIGMDEWSEIVKKTIEKLGSNRAFCQALGVAPATTRSWARGQRRPKQDLYEVVMELAEEVGSLD